ncbi:hypothetical protein M409DRAFT_62361 [Zasmidium cellare ATCC 36951]|uniref:DUF8213 domain-containing protein n=1 Tax=Zasmidium cellare ATCC 36951 TaxID=1080233 RepID=A0A6A6D4D1_ZASCE|nr:uncharacterized protein M409DRAFT_62361 [Zasmidium cellare ATCC 36951]KAF2174284.1 hypothetical protein M409DRAFT_62361 [Zasmidium cellare ATCC 36951]
MPSPTLAALLACCVLLVPTIASPFPTRSVECLDVGTNATATWTNSEGKKCTWTGVVGSNFGAKDGKYGKHGDYGCIGRCGIGCNGISVGSVYTQQCFSHDICSWFGGVGKDPNDPNCGASYKAAVDDFLVGAMQGCRHANPSLPVEAPTVRPVCI